MPKITPFLWFDGQAEEAAEFYAAIFKDSRIVNVTRYPDEGQEVTGKPAGSAMTVEFELAGLPFTALNGGPQYKFTEAVSFSVSCEGQAEVDDLWEKLTADGGEEGPCGWLKDKYGLSWQIVPTALGRCLGDPNPKKAAAAMQAMLKMKKIDIAELEKARDSAE